MENYRLITQKEMKDIDAVMYQYEHIKSGATVIHLKNNDQNKSFAIGFKTVPVDSTGVCHILEHSVLCGSDKYPLKEPFVNLLKTSLATFLNAFTSSDWTMYPFASANDKDFDNILDIYLDAVFNPLILKDKKAFLQEGWHYELFNKDDELKIKGVVYNEMKGAMSSVDRILAQNTQTKMFKDTTYAYNSGGEPNDIPSLTYEQYKDFYYKHYTPQNSLTVFYGDLDIEPRLKFIDENFFSKYDKKNEEIVIEKQNPLINTNGKVYYPIGENEEEKDNSYISLCYSLLDNTNQEELLALNILFDALLSNNESPLTKTILDAKLGEDLSYYIDDSAIIPSLYICLKKTNEDKQKDFIDLFKSTINKYYENGLDHDILLSKINKLEFINKEKNSGSMPKGITYSMALMSEFNYKVEFGTHFVFDENFKKYKKLLNENYFENLLKKYIINSNHYVSVVALPSKTLEKENNLKLEEKLRKIKENLTNEEINDLIKMNKELLAYQNKVDTNKELKCLPTLKKKDLRKDVDYIESKKMKINGINAVSHSINTNQISYLKLFFDLNKIEFDDLKYVYLLTELFTSLPTSSYSVNELTNLIDTYLGGFNVFNNIYEENEINYKPKFIISVKSLDEFIPYMSLLINEVIFKTKFKKDLVLQILKQSVFNMKQYIISNSHVCALLLNDAMHLPSRAVSSKLSPGVTLYKDLQQLLNEFDYKKIAQKLKETCLKLFNKNNCFISLTGNIDLLKKEIKKIKLPRKEYDNLLLPRLDEKENKAIIIPSLVSYNTISNLINEDYSRANLMVLQTIINYDYLWNNIRVKGGAYGAGLTVTKSKLIRTYSYRDPNVSYTLDKYNEISNYIKNLKISNKQLESYIIGTCASFEKPLSTPLYIDMGDTNYLNNISKKEKLTLKKDIIKTNLNDLINFNQKFDSWNKDATIVSITNKEKVNEFKFDKIIEL